MGRNVLVRVHRAEAPALRSALCLFQDHTRGDRPRRRAPARWDTLGPLGHRTASRVLPEMH